MGSLEVKIDAAQLEQLGDLIGSAGKQAPAALARAVNHTGDKAKTAMTRALTVQTGLKRQVIVRALKVTRASATAPAYAIRSAGGDISLKYFGAYETRAGVSAAPLGKRETIPGTFMKAGWPQGSRWSKRVFIPKWHGQVFKRAGGKTKTGMDKFIKVKSGVYIPDQMVQGATAAAFYTSVERDLPDRLVYELVRVIGSKSG